MLIQSWQLKPEIRQVLIGLHFFYLDVLLAALSDCLAEHPELVPIARIGLGSTFDELPTKHSLHKP